MIDTVKLHFTQDNFHIVRPERFDPNATGLIHASPYARNRKGRWVAYQNPTKKDKKDGVYKPRLTLTRRKFLDLKVEFSVPKLLYGNNFDEVCDTDFDLVVTELVKKLKDMGVMITPAAVQRVEVSHVDFSKNIAIEDHWTVSMILSALAKGLFSARSDLSERRFKDGGYALHLYNASNEAILYDKVAELTSSQARSIEKEAKDDPSQMNIFEAIASSGNPFEVLRIERRLKNKRVIRRMLLGYGLPDDLKFSSIFSNGLSKRVIQSVWNELYSGIAPWLVEDMDICDLIEAIFCERPKWSAQKVFSHAAFYSALLQKGDRRLRKSIWSHYHPRTRQRMLSEIKRLDLALDKVKARPFFAIDDQIISYQPLTLSNYGILTNGPKHYDHSKNRQKGSASSTCIH